MCPAKYVSIKERSSEERVVRAKTCTYSEELCVKCASSTSCRVSFILSSILTVVSSLRTVPRRHLPSRPLPELSSSSFSRDSLRYSKRERFSLLVCSRNSRFQRPQLHYATCVRESQREIDVNFEYLGCIRPMRSLSSNYRQFGIL